MKYKRSIYNFEYKRSENENVIYNTFSKALIVLDDQEYQQYKNCVNLSEELVEGLVDNGFYADEHEDEKDFLKYFHYKTKFDHKVMYLTIAPTLDCNFGCPYCYENRRSGAMSEEVQNALIEYIEDKVKNGVKCIDISWYGGEPLLFPEIVKKMSMNIMQIVEQHNGMLKMHMVTNGYLLDEKIIEMLDMVGITRIQVTIDGNEKHHNQRRSLRNGAGTYERIMHNLKLFSST